MSSVTSCVSGGLFICFTCLHVPYSTVTTIIWYTCISLLCNSPRQLAAKTQHLCTEHDATLKRLTCYAL
jgi:hypothetical protein